MVPRITSDTFQTAPLSISPSHPRAFVAEQVTDGLHSGNARQRLYWHGRIGYVLTARAAMSAAAPPSGRARSAPVADAPPRAFAAMAGAWVQPA